MASKRKKDPKTSLQAVFLRRVQEELERQHISRNQLAKRVGAPPQSTLNEIMNGADPRLESVHAIAVALGMHAVDLLTEQKIGNVHSFPTYQPISGPGDKRRAVRPHDRKKRRA